MEFFSRLFEVRANGSRFSEFGFDLAQGHLALVLDVAQDLQVTLVVRGNDGCWTYEIEAGKENVEDSV